MTFDLTQPQERIRLAKKIKSDIDAWCVVNYDDGHRKHLGASLIGHDCSRYLWYVFRWVHHHKFDGRMLRLFNRGHLEEQRFIGWLESIGAKVTAATEDGNQIRVTGCGGHFGGSVDAEIELPESYGVVGVTFINEYKTNGPSAKFTKMLSEGVRVVKPEHFDQMSIYGWKRGHRYGIYMMVNKSDENLHVEVVELDWNRAQRLELKAGMIIESASPPPRLSDSISFEKCAYCDMKGVCHKGEAYEKNCRSCIAALPQPDKVWFCQRFGQPIPEDFIPVGCDSYQEAR